MSEVDAVPPFDAVALDVLERVTIGETQWRPIRSALGVTGFGVNAFSAASAGLELIEAHDEQSAGAGGHDELYVVLTGHARFLIDGHELDAPPGMLVHVRRGATRQAWATKVDTTALVVGGRPGEALPVAPFECWYAAEPAYQAGDYDEAIRIAFAGLVTWPEHHHILYQLACFYALAGRPEEAVEYLRRAVQSDDQVRSWARDDHDLDAVRDREDYPG